MPQKARKVLINRVLRAFSLLGMRAKKRAVKIRRFLLSEFTYWASSKLRGKNYVPFLSFLAIYL